jgi:CarD family transcriptional regulator, regulator of rRNA transcription
VKLAIGEAVVYAPHGVGRIVGREDRVVAGAPRPFVVVDLAEGLTVSLPLDLAEVQLRPLASEADLRRVQETLRQSAVASDKPWLARRRDMHEKLATGGPLELAELVRDTAPRRAGATESRPERSFARGEQDVFRKARWLLSSEVAAVRGLELTEADSWIELQLASG